MTLRTVWMLLCVPGAFLPLTQLVPWILANGFDIPLFIQELFSTKVSAFFGIDVIVSAVVLIVFIISEGRRLELKYIWLPIVATLCIGVSLGLPLFLYLRQARLELKTA